MPVVVLAHVFSIVCLSLGPVRVWLTARSSAYLAKRRGSVAGKLPNARDSDDEGDQLDVDAISGKLAQQQVSQAAGKSSKGTGEHQVLRVDLEWQSICCSYAGSHGKVHVLHDIWGKAAAGEMQVSSMTVVRLPAVCNPQRNTAQHKVSFCRSQIDANNTHGWMCDLIVLMLHA